MAKKIRKTIRFTEDEYALIQQELDNYKFCGRVYYNQSDLMEWAKKQKVNVAS